MNPLALYDQITAGRTKFVRIDALCERAAKLGSLPSREELQAEAQLAQRDKKGLEKAQGAFLAEVLADPAAGMHLCHAMLLPHADSTSRVAE
jgi:thioesterase DpgC